MITALGDITDRVRGLESGADDFLTKPINDVQMLARVRSLIRIKVLIDTLILQRSATSYLGIEKENWITLPSSNKTPGIKITCLLNDPAVKHKIDKILKQDKHSLIFYQSANDILSALSKSDSCDLVILSSTIKNEDTLRLTSQIRSNSVERNIPIIMICEEEQEMLLSKALDLGVNDYIIEPIDSNELRLRVRSQVKRLMYQKLLKLSYEKSLTLSLTDELTKLYNRRYFNAHIDALLTENTNRSACLLLIDIDHFKSINDTFGHDQGDLILVEMAKLLKTSTRDSDLVARLGGEEFVVAISNATLGTGLRVAERMRQLIEKNSFPLISGGEMNISISIGVTAFTNDEKFNRDNIIKAADTALYQAKNAGRNRTVVGYTKQKEIISA